MNSFYFFLIFYCVFAGLFCVGAVTESKDNFLEKLAKLIVCIVFLGWWAMPLGLGEYISKQLEDDK